MSKLHQAFKIKPGARVKLDRIDPNFTGGFKTKKPAIGLLQKNVVRLADLGRLLYAEQKRAVLVIFQGMDAGGKDGTIRHVMGGFNPQGCRVVSFKAPAGRETEQDYLWRVHRVTPPYGEVGIFNRSHYEDVLVPRVRKLLPKQVWSKRYDHINWFERILAENGTTILKFFLHISQEEQLERFEERRKDPKKNWKLTESDLDDRKLWKDFQATYEDVISECSTQWAPWYVIPANKKWFRNLAVSQIIVDVMEAMEMSYPKPLLDLSKVSFK